MSALGAHPLRLLPAVFAEHQQLLAYCREFQGEAPLTHLTKSYLKFVGSPNGNDILEEVLVRATGREPKDDATKHGADSKDGELEAKPMKTAYNAHISDDTPASLLRHQSIPYIVLGEWTKDGTTPLWALITSYRIFDDARYRGILATFPPEYRPAQSNPTLPTSVPERKRVLEALVLTREKLIKEHNIPRYVRSNPLPAECLAALKSGQYTVWADPQIAKSRAKAHKIVWELWERQQTPYVLDAAFVGETEAIRRGFL